MSQNNATAPSVDHSNVIAQAKATMKSLGISAAKVAKACQISESALSDYLSGKYKGKVENVTTKLESWLAEQKQRTEMPVDFKIFTDFVETEGSKRIRANLQHAKMMGDFTIVYGEPGVGKTAAATHFKETNVAVWMLTASPAINSVRALLIEIADALGIRAPKTRNAALQKQIQEEVKNTDGLIIIDEAQHLSDIKCLEIIRSIHDATGVAVTFVGNEQAFSHFANKKNAQLFSRLGRKTKIPKPTIGDAKVLLKNWGIDCEETLDWLETASQSHPGALRNIAKAVKHAMISNATATPDLEQIKKSWTALIGGTKNAH